MDGETEIQVKKPLLEVYSEIHQKTGKPIIKWEYGDNINAYFLIGVLEDIKKDLLNQMDDANKEMQEN